MTYMCIDAHNVTKTLEYFIPLLLSLDNPYTELNNKIKVRDKKKKSDNYRILLNFSEIIL